MRLTHRIFATALIASITVAVPALAAEQTRPNVVMVVVDDAGYMDFGAYGGTASTPTIDALAARGASFTRYYSSPQCAPSRAMLLTGADNHEVGIGTISEAATPEMRQHQSYQMKLSPRAITLAEHLGAAGYRTIATGKWGIGDVGSSLPNEHGFDRSFVLDATGSDNWEAKPYLPVYKSVQWYEDSTPVERPKDVYSSELIIDKTIKYIDATPADKPFFAYVAFQAIHLPIQAPRAFIDRYNGRFDAGWDRLRQTRFIRAKALGLIPQNAVLAAMPEGARTWDSLDEPTQALMARMMQVNAGMLEAMDFHLGRLIDHLVQKGLFENTVIVVVSDNGPESAVLGDRPGMALWNWLHDYDTKIENLGERGSMAGIGPEWASVSAAPLSRFKFYSTEGGLRVPLVIAGPGVSAQGFVPALSYVIDLVPTLLDLAGVPVFSGGANQIAIRGRSLQPILAGTQTEVYSPTDAVGFEVSGNAALYRGQWKILKMPAPMGDGEWHLYDLTTDPGETHDLRAEFPNLFTEMQAEYQSYAQDVGVIDPGLDYNPFKQIQRNGIKLQLSIYGTRLALFLAALIGVIWWAIRRFRRRRTPV